MHTPKNSLTFSIPPKIFSFCTLLTLKKTLKYIKVTPKIFQFKNIHKNLHTPRTIHLCKRKTPKLSKFKMLNPQESAKSMYKCKKYKSTPPSTGTRRFILVLVHFRFDSSSYEVQLKKLMYTNVFKQQNELVEGGPISPLLLSVLKRCFCQCWFLFS